MAIVNAQLMADLAIEFNIGADILGKGNRFIEKHLGADNMSGDTVQVPIMDNGKTYRTLDLSAYKGTLGVNRGAVPVSVAPIVSAAEVNAEDLLLSIKNPQIMAKRVANLVEQVNQDAFHCLVGASQAFVASAKTADAINEAMFDGEAHTSGCKMAGETYGIIHPQTWNRVVPKLQANFGNGGKANDLYRNELGDYMGFRWTKGADLTRIIGVAQGFGTFAISASTGMNTTGITGSVSGTYDGELSQPIKLTGTDASSNTFKVHAVDALGKSTGLEKTVYLKWDATNSEWNLANPIFFDGPRKNVECSATAPTSLTFSCADVLATGTTYLSPAVMWKQPDFMVAVKGLEKAYGNDSFTVPVQFREKGILPLRGTCWTDPYASLTLFRVDAMFGFNMYQGCSASSVYIPA